jgi:hypothetical protein
VACGQSEGLDRPISHRWGKCYKPHERCGWSHSLTPFHGPPLTVYCLAPGGPKFFYFVFGFSLLLLFLNTFSLRPINFLFPYYRPDMQKHGYRSCMMSPYFCLDTSSTSTTLTHPITPPLVFTIYQSSSVPETLPSGTISSPRSSLPIPSD